MSEIKHTPTPTPWYTEGDGAVRGSNGNTIPIYSGYISEAWLGEELAKANAAFIVEAVNSHASLVEENRRLREALTFYADKTNYEKQLVTEDCGCCSYWHDAEIGPEGDCGERARAALSQGQQP